MTPPFPTRRLSDLRGVGRLCRGCSGAGHCVGAGSSVAGQSGPARAVRGLMARVLVTRPQPGADTTAERLSALGHDVRTAPLFTVHSLQWSPPGEVIDALMVTSANAMRLSGPLPEAWRALPC